MQTLGLVLNLIGTILFGFGVLDGSRATRGDVANKSKKKLWIRRFAWLGFIMIVFGFAIQIYSIN